MTKLGFVAKGMAENRSKAKRRKAPVSSGSAVARSPVFSFAGADGIVIRITSVHPPRRRKFATLKRTMVAQQNPMLRKLSTYLLKHHQSYPSVC